MKKFAATLGIIASIIATSPGSAQQTRAYMNNYNTLYIGANGENKISGPVMNQILGYIINGMCTLADAVNCPLASIGGLGVNVAAAMANALNGSGGLLGTGALAPGVQTALGILPNTAGGFLTSGSSTVGIPNASGSSTQTTASCNSTTTITLAAAIDFVNGEGARFNKCGLSMTLGQPTGLVLANSSATGSTTYTYSVACLDANGGVGQSIANVSITNAVATITNINYVELAWSGPAGTACSAFAVYGRNSGSMALLAITQAGTWNDYGITNPWYAPDWVPTAPQTGGPLNDYLLTKIISGGGTTSLVVANAASQTASSVLAAHDDTAAINAAIAACGTKPCNISIAALYPITGQGTAQAIALGNGNGTAAGPSTVNGVKLVGVGAAIAPTGIGGLPIVGNGLVYQGYGSAVVNNGPTSGMGMSDVAIQINGGSVQTDAFYEKCGSYGSFNRMIIVGVPGIGIAELGGTTCAGTHNDYMSNKVFLGNYSSSAVGVFASGTPTSGSTYALDTYENHFYHTLVQPAVYGLSQTCFYFQVTDTDYFFGLECDPVDGNPAHTVFGAVFDYSTTDVSTPGGWPGGLQFYGWETWSNTILNIGSPNANTFNVIYGYSTGNGGAVPTNPGLIVGAKSCTSASALRVQQGVVTGGTGC